jgi:hypothetical protein
MAQQSPEPRPKVQAILDRFAEQQGWNEDSQLAIMIGYAQVMMDEAFELIGEDADQAFEDYLQDIADTENEGSGDWH